MTPTNQAEGRSAKLRRRAEQTVAKRTEFEASRASGDTRRLIHELEVHQVELELQNEELRQARVEIEATYNRAWTRNGIRP